MTFLSNILGKLGRQRTNETHSADPGSRDTDRTTGTGESETAVGRVAGQDQGYLETGAEKRAETEGEDPDKPAG